MLYVFLVETGQTYCIDTCFTTETVAALKSQVSRLCHVSPEKQVMLVSGGISLDNNCRVAQYCAGTDTNPIFVFSKSSIEAAIPPPPCINYGTDKDLSDSISEVVLLPATHETVSDAYKLAKETHECDSSRMDASQRLIHDQHLQQQGWAAAIANLDDHLMSFNRRVEKFQNTCKIFLKTQEESREMLSKVPEILNLLGRIPLLKSLQTLVTSPVVESNPVDPTLLEGEERTKEASLLDWIYQQDPRSSLEDMVDQCKLISEQISEKSIEKLKTEINDLLKFVDRPDMKEVKGLEHRLYQLDQLITNTRAIMDKQTKFFQKFTSQLETTTRMDCESLSEYWKNHKKDLMELSDGHTQIKIFKNRCCKAKEELSNNLHVRLKWVMWVEQLIMEKERNIKIESEKIKRQRKRLKILQQVHDAAKMYIDALLEIIRRKHYSIPFLTWAKTVAIESNSLYSEEIRDRQAFYTKFGKHFIQSLFHGLHDEPSKFATNSPRSFDHNIPEVTIEDIEKLKKAVPELASSLIMPPKKKIYTRLCTNVSEKVFQELRTKHPEMVEERLSLKLHSPIIPKDSDTKTKQSIAPLGEFPTGVDPLPYVCPMIRVDPKQDQRARRSSNHQQISLTVDSHTQTATEGIVEPSLEEKDSTLTKSESPPKLVGQVTHGPIDVCKLSSEIDAANRSVEQSSESLSSRKQLAKGHLASDTSPEIETSQEFTTADFYFDESMPSSIEAPSHKGIPKEELHKLLQEKCELSEKLSRELQACRTRSLLTADKLKTLKDVTERSVPEFREQLCNLHELVRQNQTEFVTHADLVQENLLEAIRMFNANKEKERTENFLSFQKEHELAMQALTDKVSQADRRIASLGQEKANLEDVYKQSREECEKLIQKVTELNVENEKCKELNQKYLLEREVELDKQRSEFQELLDQKEMQLSEKCGRMSCLQSQVESLTQEIACMSESYTQKYEREKTELIENLKMAFVTEKNSAILETKQQLTDEHNASMDSLKADFIHLQAKYDNVWQECNETKECALNDLRLELAVAEDAKLCQLNQQLDDSAARLKKYEAELEQTKAELCACRQLEARLEACRDGESQTDDSVISLAVHEQILRDIQKDCKNEIEAEKREINQALKEMHEKEMQQLKRQMQAEEEEKLNSQRTLLTAEKQLVFNQALSKLAEEKDQIIFEFEKKLNELTCQNQKVEDLSQTEEELKKNRMHVVQLEQKIQQMESYQQQLQDELVTASQDVEPASLDVTARSEEEDKLMEMEKTMKFKDERIEKLQHKVMELSMSASVLEQDKVSITSFQSGDLVLLCLDEEHGHYVVFTVGNTLHFLHTDCLDNLGLRPGPSTPREPWVLGVITDKEYCIAKKPQNRYRVPQGTKFYRVRAKPWPKDPRLTREGGSIGVSASYHGAAVIVTTTTAAAATTTTTTTSTSTKSSSSNNTSS